MGAFVIFVGIIIAGTQIDFWNWIIQTYRMRPFTLRERVFTEFRVIIHYLSLFFAPLPGRFNLDYDFPFSTSLITPPTTLLSGILLLAVLGIAIPLYRKEPLVSFGILWFLGNLVIESSVIGLDLVFEHRMYLPMVGLLLVFGALFYKLILRLNSKSANYTLPAKVFLIIIGLTFALAAYQRNKVWSNEISLWRDVAKKSPDKVRVKLNLGMAYDVSGDYDKAVEYYRLVLVKKPQNIITRLKLAGAYHSCGLLDKAATEYKKLINMYPDLPPAHAGLAKLYEEQSLSKQADIEYKKVLKLNAGCKSTDCHDEMG